MKISDEIIGMVNHIEELINDLCYLADEGKGIDETKKMKEALARFKGSLKVEDIEEIFVSGRDVISMASKKVAESLDANKVFKLQGIVGTLGLMLVGVAGKIMDEEKNLESLDIYTTTKH